MEGDEEGTTHTCSNCEALIHYRPCHVPEGALIPIANCPKCGTFIPEPQGGYNDHCI